MMFFLYKAQNEKFLPKQTKPVLPLGILFLYLCGAPVYSADADPSDKLHVEKKDRQHAVEHFNKGMALYHESNFKSAAAEFERANKLCSTRDGIFYLVKCYLEMKRYIDAASQIAFLKKRHGEQLTGEWRARILEIEQKINAVSLSVSIEVNIDGALVSLDGKPIGVTPIMTPIRMEMREHEVLVTKEGYEPQILEITDRTMLEPSLSVTLYKMSQQEEALAPLDSEKDDGMQARPVRRKRIWTWVAFGLGGATGIAAIVTGTKAISLRRDVEENCINNVCPADQKADIDTSNSLRISTNVLIGVTAASVIAGTILFFTEGKQKSEPVAVVPLIAPDSAGIIWFKTF